MGQMGIKNQNDHQKRMAVMFLPRRTVLVKITTANDPIPGIRMTERDEKAVAGKHRDLASELDLETRANYRPATDTGLPVFKSNAKGARLAPNFVEQLANLGLKFVDAHYFRKGAKGDDVCVNTFVFSVEGEEMKMTDAFRAAFALKFAGCYIWANRNKDENGDIFRIDTINLTHGVESDKPGAIVNIKGRTYSCK